MFKVLVWDDYEIVFFNQVDVIDSNGLIMLIFVWVKKLDQEIEQRVLVVMELVERIVVMVIFNVEVYFGILNSIFYKIIVMEIKKLEN